MQQSYVLLLSVIYKSHFLIPVTLDGRLNDASIQDERRQVESTLQRTRCFKRVRKIAKSDSYLRNVCLSFCPSAKNNSASTG
jgi:hypothetical protein